MSAVDPDFESELSAKKRANVPQLLFKCARLVNDRAVSMVRKRTGLDDFRAAHTALFPHIDLEGTRLTTLAERLGITKQAVGQLVAELVEMGALEKVPDPTDGRAKLIRFSTQGRFGLLEGLAVLDEVTAELEELVGAETVATMHRALLTIVDLYEEEDEQG